MSDRRVRILYNIKKFEASPRECCIRLASAVIDLLAKRSTSTAIMWVQRTGETIYNPPAIRSQLSLEAGDRCHYRCNVDTSNEGSIVRRPQSIVGNFPGLRRSGEMKELLLVRRYTLTEETEKILDRASGRMSGVKI